MRRLIIEDNPELFEALKLSTQATPWSDLDRHIHAAAVPDMFGFLLFQEEGVEQAVSYIESRTMEDLISFLAAGGTPEEALCYAINDPDVLGRVA